jgi:hypothetical protein
MTSETLGLTLSAHDKRAIVIQTLTWVVIVLAFVAGLGLLITGLVVGSVNVVAVIGMTLMLIAAPSAATLLIICQMRSLFDGIYREGLDDGRAVARVVGMSPRH